MSLRPNELRSKLEDLALRSALSLVFCNDIEDLQEWYDIDLDTDESRQAFDSFCGKYIVCELYEYHGHEALCEVVSDLEWSIKEFNKKAIALADQCQ